MPNNRRSKGGRRGRRGGNTNPVTQYQAPIYRKITLDKVAFTLVYSQQIGSGLTAANGLLYTVNWNDFRDVGAMSKLFRYFDVVGHKVEFSMATTEAARDSYVRGAVAWLPVNYHVEGAYTIAPDVARPILELPGAINVQEGAKNLGRWFANPYKQTFSTGDAFPVAHPAGNILAYFDDLGVSETIGSVTVYTNVVLWSREYNPTNPTIAENHQSSIRAASPETSVVTVSKKLRK